MIYVHKRTGAVIDSPTVISGGSWVEKGAEDEVKKPIEAAPVVEEAPEEEEAVEEKAEPKSIDGMTKADIIQELEAFGIKYSNKMNKSELYALMMEGM